MNNIKFTVENPDDVAVTLQVCAKLTEWKELKKQITRRVPEITTHGWPLSTFMSVINDVIDQAEKHFYPKNPI